MISCRGILNISLEAQNCPAICQSYRKVGTRKRSFRNVRVVTALYEISCFVVVSIFAVVFCKRLYGHSVNITFDAEACTRGDLNPLLLCSCMIRDKVYFPD
jgi:hypothetical protein